MRARTRLIGYSTAVALSIAAIALKWLLDTLVGFESPFLLLLVPAVLSAWYGGVLPGFVATLLSGLAAALIFIPHQIQRDMGWTDGLRVCIFMAEGAFVSTLAASRDRAQARAAQVLESITDAFFTLNDKFQVTYWNQPAHALLGFAASISQPDLWETLPRLRGTLFESELRRAMFDRSVRHFDFCDSEVKKWFEIHAYPADGGTAVLARDITTWKNEEQEAVRLAAIVESSDDAIYSKTLDGIILSWNRGAERIYGYTADETIGQPAAMLAAPDRPDEVPRILERIRRGERVQHMETLRRRKDGTLIPVSLTISPIRDRRGQLLAASSIARDISRQKEMERQVIEAQKLESLGVLAGGIAHDFNNLLTGIMGNATLAAEIARDEMVRTALEQIVNASQRAADLTRQMLAYSGRGRFVVEPLDLSALVSRMAAQLQTRLPSKVTLNLDLIPDLPAVEADRSQMEQLITNLVVNAGEAIGNNPGSITIRTQALDQKILLEVSDTGPGIPEDIRTRIFDPFFTTKFTGRGLGLAAVSGIVRGHGGEIELETEPGHGATFRVLLPIAAWSEA